MESANHVIANNTIYNGIVFYGDFGSIVSNNIIHGGIELSLGYRWSDPGRVSIVGNQLIGGGTGGAAVFLGRESGNINVANNTIENAAIGIYEQGGVWHLPFTSVRAYNNYIGNRISSCGKGISFENPNEFDVQIDPSSFSTVARNLLYNNTCGIYVKWVDSIKVYHNNFSNNSVSFLADLHPDYNTNNTLDDGYPSGGNYWSNYAEVDFFSGPYQNETGSDGIWDQPYIIDPDNQDNYPFVEPWPPSPPLQSTADVEPDRLNFRNVGEWLSAYIQLPVGYTAADIDAATILLNGTIHPVLDSAYSFATNPDEYLIDHNSDGIIERMVKFDRALVQSFIYGEGIKSGQVALTLTGRLYDNTSFEGIDVIYVFTNPPFKH